MPNSGLKAGSVLVHCGAGVSRILVSLSLVHYLCDRLPHEISQKDFPSGNEADERKESGGVPKFRLRTSVKEVSTTLEHQKLRA